MARGRPSNQEQEIGLPLTGGVLEASLLREACGRSTLRYYPFHGSYPSLRGVYRLARSALLSRMPRGSSC